MGSVVPLVSTVLLISFFVLWLSSCLTANGYYFRFYDYDYTNVFSWSFSLFLLIGFALTDNVKSSTVRFFILISVDCLLFSGPHRIYTTIWFWICGTPNSRNITRRASRKYIFSIRSFTFIGSGLVGKDRIWYS